MTQVRNPPHSHNCTLYYQKISNSCETLTCSIVRMWAYILLVVCSSIHGQLNHTRHLLGGLDVLPLPYERSHRICRKLPRDIHFCSAYKNHIESA